MILEKIGLNNNYCFSGQGYNIMGYYHCEGWLCAYVINGQLRGYANRHGDKEFHI